MDLDWCPYCSIIFNPNTVEEIKQKHLELCKVFYPYVEEEWRCQLCKEEFKSQSGLYIHLSKKHPEVQTSEPPKAGTDQEPVAKKQKLVTEKTAYDLIEDKVCMVCDEEFKYVFDALDHVNDKHADILNPNNDIKLEPDPDEKSNEETCQICLKIFGSKERLDKHIAKRHAEQPSEESSDNDKVNEDEVKTETVVINAVPCTTCGRVFGTSERLLKHIKKRHWNAGNDNAGGQGNQSPSTSENPEDVNEPPEAGTEEAIANGHEIVISGEPVSIPVKLEPLLQDSKTNDDPEEVTDIAGPKPVTRLFACSMCTSKYASLTDVHQHLEEYHRISRNINLFQDLHIESFQV